MSLLFTYIKQNKWFLTKKKYIIILVDFYVSLCKFFCYPDPDQRFLKWIWIWPYDTDPTGSLSGSETLLLGDPGVQVRLFPGPALRWNARELPDRNREHTNTTKSIRFHLFLSFFFYSLIFSPPFPFFFLFFSFSILLFVLPHLFMSFSSPFLFFLPFLFSPYCSNHRTWVVRVLLFVVRC